jgi:hypothetical protein
MMNFANAWFVTSVSISGTRLVMVEFRLVKLKGKTATHTTGIRMWVINRSSGVRGIIFMKSSLAKSSRTNFFRRLCSGRRRPADQNTSGQNEAAYLPPLKLQKPVPGADHPAAGRKPGR